jgi:hypothetical protein
MTLTGKKTSCIITEHKHNILKAFFIHLQMKTLIQTIIDKTQTNQILPGLLFSPTDKSRLFSKYFEHLCSMIMGTFLVRIGDISLTTLHENFYFPCYVREIFIT